MARLTAALQVAVRDKGLREVELEKERRAAMDLSEQLQSAQLSSKARLEKVERLKDQLAAAYALITQHDLPLPTSNPPDRDAFPTKSILQVG